MDDVNILSGFSSSCLNGIQAGTFGFLRISQQLKRENVGIFKAFNDNFFLVKLVFIPHFHNKFFHMLWCICFSHKPFHLLTFLPVIQFFREIWDRSNWAVSYALSISSIVRKTHVDNIMS